VIRQYKLLKRIQKGTKTIGFQLIAPNRRLVTLTIGEVYQLALNGSIENVGYDRRTKGLAGDGLDLRTLPKIRAGELGGTENKPSASELVTYTAVARLVKQHNPQGYILKFDKTTVCVDARQYNILLSHNRINKASIDTCKTVDYIHEAERTVIAEGRNGNNTSNNHQKAKLYEAKCSLTGIDSVIEYSLLPQDQVELLSYGGLFYDKPVVVPSFITKFRTIIRNDKVISSPFRTTNIPKIRIDNQAGVPLDCTGLFSGIDSEELSITFTHPECVVCLDYAFYDCRQLKKLELVGFTGENLVSIQNIFDECGRLETISMPDINPKNLIDIRKAFLGCHKLEFIDAPKLDLRKSKLREFAFFKCGKEIKGIDSDIKLDLVAIDTKYGLMYI